MFCRNCGNELRDGARFCNNCGYAVQCTIPLLSEEEVSGNIAKTPQVSRPALVSRHASASPAAPTQSGPKTQTPHQDRLPPLKRNENPEVNLIKTPKQAPVSSPVSEAPAVPTQGVPEEPGARQEWIDTMAKSVATQAVDESIKAAVNPTQTPQMSTDPAEQHQSVATKDVPKSTEDLDTTKTAVGIGLILAPRLLALIAIICFFFPFMSVSCGQYSTEISGTDMIFGDSSISEQIEDFSEGESDGSLFNWFILLAGLFALGGVVHLKSKEAAEASGLSVLFLFIFRVTAKWYYKIGDTRLSEIDDSVIQVEFGAALYWAIVLLCIAAVIHLLYAVMEQNQDDS